MEPLFVYGSLRQGCSAHHLLQGCHRLSDGVLAGSELIDHAGYPMLQAGNGEVKGEVYRVKSSRWPVLDAWEEAPQVYERVVRRLVDGRSVWVYQRPIRAAAPLPGKNEV